MALEYDYEKENKIIRSQIYALERLVEILFAMAFSKKEMLSAYTADVIRNSLESVIPYNDKEFLDHYSVPAIRKFIDDRFQCIATILRSADFPYL